MEDIAGMVMMDNIMNKMREEANKSTIEEIKNGNISMDKNYEILPYFLSANLTSNPQIIDVFEAMAEVIMGEDMKKEYVLFFLNKIREIANDTKEY